MLSVGIMYDDINYPMIDQTIFIKTEKKEQIFGARCVLIAYIASERPRCMRSVSCACGSGRQGESVYAAASS